MLEKGCVHLYCGDGKGKSTAAAGLALRCAGSGNRVLFVQFFKDGSSGEIDLLQRCGITTMHSNTIPGMVFQLSHTEIRTVQRDYTALLQQALEQRIERLRQYPAGKQLWFRYGLILY